MIPKVAVALLFIGLNLYVFRYFASDDFIPDRLSFDVFPLFIDEWKCREPQQIGQDVIDNLGVTDYLLCDFISSDSQRAANLYVGYHESQTRRAGDKETLIHPPEHCLPGGGWDIIASEVVPADWAPSGEVKRVVIAKGNLRSLVYFWYQSRGRTIARNHEKVLYMFLDRATKRRTDGSLVRFTVPIIRGNEEAAEETFRSLATSVTPLLDQYVPN